jgi:membrane-bound lytic murein transglycosylase D
VEERELPWELAYLPAVESAFQIHAVSSSGAAGLWQFMTNSIGPYGMIVDEWRDDRRDFVKATAGALQKLADNYRVLGDWFLALAAYNCGLGRVQRTLAQSGLSTYWELCEGNLLPAQTIHFVPRLLALSRLLGYPGRRGLELDWTPPLEWARIPLNRGVDLRLLAGASGVPYEVLLAGNASLRYGISPQEYELKVPAEFSDVVTRVLSESQNELLRFYLYRIKPGDTLYGLSRHYEVPLSLIERHNPQLRAELLRVGETVIIPALKEKEPYPGRSVQTAAPRADWTGVYRVAPGDTLWGIARRFSLGVQELAGNNGLDPEGLLLAGTVLQVPASGP